MRAIHKTISLAAVLMLGASALPAMAQEASSITAVGAVVSAAVFNATAGGLFLAGGALSTLSFLWMKRTVAGILNRKKAAAVRSGLFFYALRFVLILGIFFLIILAYPDKILAFAAGFSMAVPAFVVEAFRAYALMKTWKD